MRTYTVIVHEEDDKADGFWAEVKELPGCFASGETLEELEQDVRDGIETYLLALKEMGHPDPEPKVITEPELCRWEISVPDIEALVD
jgi:predicted RNase H-like HicB family nuclease